MNHTIVKRLSGLLALVILMSFFASCGNGGEDTPDTSDDTSASEADTLIDREHTPDNLPSDLNYGGATVSFARSDGTEFKQELDPDDDHDPVNEAVHERNVSVEDRLKVKFEVNNLGNVDQTVAAIARSITSGSSDYDIIFEHQWKLLPQSLEHLFIDLWGNEYIDLDQPWWWTDYINELKIGDSTFFALNGDICLTAIKYISAMFFNKNMISKYNIDPDSVYALVLNGKWTYAEFTAWSEMAYADLNGNGTKDDGDQYGAILRWGTEPDHFTYTAGNSMNYRDEDGYPVLNVETEHFTEFMNFLVNMYYQNPGILMNNEIDRDASFRDGKTLFHATQLQSADRLRDMTDEYGVIPFPKWDTQQESYGALVHDSATLVAIATTSKNVDMSSAVTEAMCAQNYRTVVPAYYDVALKCKYVSDSTSGVIIDMIKNVARTDFVYAYNYALGGAGLICRTMVINKSTNLSSEWRKIKSVATGDLRKIIKSFESKK